MDNKQPAVRAFVLVLLGLLLSLTASAQELNSLTPQGYVSDFANVLTPADRQGIETYAGRLEQVTGVQMALVTINSLKDQPIEDAANSLFRRWGIGKKGKDEGLLLLLAVQDHKDRIEVGYGLEPILPDGFVGSVLRAMSPSLKQGDYNQALLTATEEMGSRIALAKGVTLDFTPARQPRLDTRPQRGSGGIPWPFIIIGLFLLFGLFNRGGRGGGGGGFLTGMILGNVLGSSNRRWGGGGGFGGYDSGGGGGGGFGGFGGGDSGGGGASGSW